MTISVLTPDQEIFQGLVTSVKVPGALGEFQVRNNHAPIVSALEAGKVTLIAAEGTRRVYNDETGHIEETLNPGQAYTFTVQGGFIEGLNNNISLLVRGVKMSSLPKRS